MPADWQQFMPSSAEIAVDKLIALERDAVKRIATSFGLGSSTSHIETSEEFTIATGFPLRLVPHALTKRQLYNLEADLAKRPTKSPLYEAHEELCTRMADYAGMLGLLFTWPGHGSRMQVFHDMITMEFGRAGRYYKINGKVFFLEGLVSVLDRVGPADEW